MERVQTMGMFSKKVRFYQMGILNFFACTCGLQETDDQFTGMDYGIIRPDEIVPGYSSDVLEKCGACGAIFKNFRQKDAGKIVGRGRSYGQERAEGLDPNSI